MAREVEPTIDAKVKVKDSPDEQWALIRAVWHDKGGGAHGTLRYFALICKACVSISMLEYLLYIHTFEK
jgi:hypothetical protein